MEKLVLTELTRLTKENRRSTVLTELTRLTKEECSVNRAHSVNERKSESAVLTELTRLTKESRSSKGRM